MLIRSIALDKVRADEAVTYAQGDGSKLVTHLTVAVVNCSGTKTDCCLQGAKWLGSIVWHH